jgi:phage terminase large subunit GpA-like protein
VTTLDVLETDLAYLDVLTDDKPIAPPPATVSGYAEANRVLPPGTPIPGPWSNKVTPYLVEIMDCFSAFSPVRNVTLMKARKTGATTGVAENVVAYWVNVGAPQAYVTSSDELAKDWATIKLPPILSSFGLDSKIVAQDTTARGRRSGSSTYKKEYFGGVLDAFSAGSRKARRALDKRILLIDEVDGERLMLSTGEGNWVEVLLGHLMAWGDRGKAFLFSSPITEEESNIYKYYLLGDQRHYFVPCPKCGKLQELTFDLDAPEKTMRPIYDEGGHLLDAKYLCQAEGCGYEISSIEKDEMIQCEQTGGRAEWRATSNPADLDNRSYYINALYAPHEFLTFADFYKAYLKAIKDPDDEETGVRSFTNIYMGLPFKQKGQHPELEGIARLRADYPIGSPPAGVIYITGGADVHPDRIEIQFLGIGEGYRTWSIDYRIFDGPTDNPFAGAWEALYQVAATRGFQYTRADGLVMSPKLILFDSGDAHEGRDEIVHTFVQRLVIGQSCKGSRDLVVDPRRHEKGDAPGRDNVQKYRRTRIGESDQYMYLISTNFYKELIYNKLATLPSPTGELPARGVAFPSDYTEAYFMQLIAEERRADGSYHNPHKRRNEALDTFVYALCASDVWLDNEVRKFRENFMKWIREGWKREPTQAEMDTQTYHSILMLIEQKQREAQKIK